MILHSFRVKNFRRLKDTFVDLESDISIFVGSNNSGKTSATQILEMFVNGGKDKFSIHDFSSDTWATFNEIGNTGFVEGGSNLPVISLDIWFEIAAADLHRVLDLLPSLSWEGSRVGMRMALQPKIPTETHQRYTEARAKVAAFRAEDGAYSPWPKNLFDYLDKELSQEYELAYFALNEAHFDESYNENEHFVSMRLQPENGKRILKSLIRVDCLNAQRHLSDVNSHARAEDLSKCLSRFYKRNLQKREEDHVALRALSNSENELNTHLADVFSDTLSRLSALGYPGFSNPNLVIRSALNPTQIMTQDTRVHYSLDGANPEATLPDSYNGLGFKNLIYMVVEILDLQARWIEEEDDRSLLHLIFIEEPEAHLHAQLQQVFVRQVLSLLEIEDGDAGIFTSQIIVTSHSPHILYERGFKPIRYFRRSVSGGVTQSSTCQNLSFFYRTTSAEDRDFLERYLKLTHCDLFFADAAILVEGNVERLLLPLMIKKSSPRLQSAYTSIMEVGGAFAHKFKSLLEFLGIVTLIITDIDSSLPVVAPQQADANNQAQNEEDDDDLDEDIIGAGKACLVSTAGAVTSNQTLLTWLPRKRAIADLLSATAAEKTQEPTATSAAKMHVVYQNNQTITWKDETVNVAGRTLEEAFGLENAAWCQNRDNRQVGLRFAQEPADIAALAAKLHKRINAKHFDKTKFALNVLAADENAWNVPGYIAEGLSWLNQQINLEPRPVAIAEPVIAEGVALRV